MESKKSEASGSQPSKREDSIEELQLLPVRRAAAILGLSPSGVRNIINQGILEAGRLGEGRRKLLVPLRALKALIASYSTKAKPHRSVRMDGGAVPDLRASSRLFLPASSPSKGNHSAERQRK